MIIHLDIYFLNLQFDVLIYLIPHYLYLKDIHLEYTDSDLDNMNHIVLDSFLDLSLDYGLSLDQFYHIHIQIHLILNIDYSEDYIH